MVARWILTAVVAAFLLCAQPRDASAGVFTRAFTDDVWFNANGQQWVSRTVSSGAKLVLIEMDWSTVEPQAPAAGSDPTDPGAPRYRFGAYDAVLRRFAGTGISPALLVTDAPTWAETPGGPPDLEARGAWEPSPSAFGQLATALARRYSGTYPDPLRSGHALPRVRYFQAWGEANFAIHLAPQWTSQDGSWVPVGPSMYRGLLNAFYAGIKSVRPDDVVISSGLGPYGDPAGICPASEYGNGCRMPPAEFARDLLCLQGQALAPGPCPNPARFDVMAMDPYEVSAPTQHAFNPDDVSAPDLGKLTRILRRASATGRALPRTRKPLWVTEFGYESNPPNPTAPSVATQARWLEQALYLFWRQGVSTAVWYLISDQPGRNYNVNYYSGVYFNNGRPKRSLDAFRFPLVVMPSGSRATVWGIAPRTGIVIVQRQVGGRWRTLFRLRAHSGAVFARNISARMGGRFRARVGPESSLVWRR